MSPWAVKTGHVASLALGGGVLCLKNNQENYYIHTCIHTKLCFHVWLSLCAVQEQESLEDTTPKQNQKDNAESEQKMQVYLL